MFAISSNVRKPCLFCGQLLKSIHIIGVINRIFSHYIRNFGEGASHFLSILTCNWTIMSLDGICAPITAYCYKLDLLISLSFKAISLTFMVQFVLYSCMVQFVLTVWYNLIVIRSP